MENANRVALSEAPSTVAVEIDREILGRVCYLYAPRTPRSLIEGALKTLIAKEEKRYKRWARSYGMESVDADWELRLAAASMAERTGAASAEAGVPGGAAASR
jgi:hypothetical protein